MSWQRKMATLRVAIFTPLTRYRSTSVSDWVSSIKLESPITEQVLLLFGRNGITNNPIGSAPLIAPRLAITVMLWLSSGVSTRRRMWSWKTKGTKTPNSRFLQSSTPGTRLTQGRIEDLSSRFLETASTNNDDGRRAGSSEKGKFGLWA